MVHYHFADKRDLILALVVHARRDWVEPLEELVDGPGSGVARMRAVISWMAEPQTTEVMRVHQSLFVFALQDQVVRRRLAGEFARWRAPFIKLFGDVGEELRVSDLDARSLGEAFAAAADALVQQQSLDPALPTERMLTDLFERMIGRAADGDVGSAASRRRRSDGGRSAAGARWKTAPRPTANTSSGRTAEPWFGRGGSLRHDAR
jgi:AcrR family transcriptional regulator